MRKTWFQKRIFLMLRRNKFLLCANVFTGLGVVKQFPQNLEVSLGVKLEEPLHKLFVGAEADHVVDVVAPVVTREGTCRELFTF